MKLTCYCLAATVLCCSFLGSQGAGTYVWKVPVSYPLVVYGNRLLPSANEVDVHGVHSPLFPLTVPNYILHVPPIKGFRLPVDHFEDRTQAPCAEPPKRQSPAPPSTEEVPQDTTNDPPQLTDYLDPPSTTTERTTTQRIDPTTLANGNTPPVNDPVTSEMPVSGEPGTESSHDVGPPTPKDDSFLVLDLKGTETKRDEAWFTSDGRHAYLQSDGKIFTTDEVERLRAQDDPGSLPTTMENAVNNAVKRQLRHSRPVLTAYELGPDYPNPTNPIPEQRRQPFTDPEILGM